jgi:hypothetical protein
LLIFLYNKKTIIIINDGLIFKGVIFMQTVSNEILKIQLLSDNLMQKYLKQGYKFLCFDEKSKTVSIKNDRNYTIEYNGKTVKMYNPHYKNTLITDGTNWQKKKYDEENRLIKEEFSTGRIIEYSYYPNGLLRLKKDNYGTNEYYEYDSKGQETYFVCKDNEDNEVRWTRKEELDGGNCIHIYDSIHNWRYYFKEKNLTISGKKGKVKNIKIGNEPYIYSSSRYNNFVALLVSGELYFKNVKKQYTEDEIFIFSNLFQISNYEFHAENLRKLKQGK